MEDGPFITGGDLISNPGNAGLGYSAYPGKSPISFNIGPDSKPLDGLNTTIDKLQDEEAKVQVARYQERLKQAEDLKKAMAQSGGSVFNTADANGKNMSFTALPQDQATLNKSADDRRRYIVNNPTTYAYDPDYYKKNDEHDQLVRHAGERAVFNAKANIDAANENDPAERKAILDNRDQNLSHPLTDFQPLDPHLPKLRWNYNDIYSQAEFSKEKNVPLKTFTKTDKDGNLIEYNLMGSPIADIDKRGLMQPGSKLFDETAINLTNGFLKSNLSKDPNEIQGILAGQKEFNETYGLTPNNSHYMKPIAHQLPNGQYVLDVDPTTVSGVQDLIYALTAPKRAAATSETKLKEDASHLETAAAGVKNIESEIGDRAVKNKLKGQEDAETHRHNVAMENKDKEKSENSPEIDNAFATVLRNQANAQSAQSYPLVKTIKNLPSSQQEVINKALKEKGLNPKDYDVVPLDNNDQTMQSIAGIQNQAGNGEYIDGSAKPQSSIMLKAHSGNLNDNFYVIGHTSLEPDINPTTGLVNIGQDKKPSYKQKEDIKLIDAPTAGGNRIKEIHNFKVTDKSGNSMSGVANKLKDVIKVRKAPDGKIYYQTKDGAIHEL